ncbi:MAG TPA: PD-(D/E)XK nuclease family protein, partial [Phototrophicaceae bacterium]|nr:PD-(D/E)XK nuclease family protein [Phototrophicaceae bacterium]
MELLLARVGAGKTASVRDRLLDLKRQKPLASVWVLLSTERQIDGFRQRFGRDQRALFNVETFNFYSLYKHVLASSGRPQRSLDDTARFGLIRALLADLYRDGGGLFGGIAHMPGFIQVIAAFTYELKQNLITPEALQAAAGSDKELELATIYAEYQLALRKHDLVDQEGEGWLALEALENLPQIGRAVDLLIVDGYDQFNRLQAELLTVLGAQAREAIVTLTTIPGREATIGRRFQDALERLNEAHQARRKWLIQIPFTAHEVERSPALRHLSEQLLLPHPQQIDADGAVQWVEAPDPTREVGAVLRRVKRLLIDGSQPDDILIALRDWPLYGGALAAQGQIYGLPLALHYGEPLARNPAIVALLDLLALHQNHFRRRDLLDTLRSPYFAVPEIAAEQVDLLDQISNQWLVMSGRSAWLDALDLATRPAALSPDDDDSEVEGLQIDREVAARLKEALAQFFRRITPPEVARVDVYVGWLEDLIGHDLADLDLAEDEPLPAYTLALPMQIRKDADFGLVSRDLAALNEFKRVLRGLLAAQALAGSLGYTDEIEWKTFFRDLRTTVDNTTVGRGGSRDGRVLVTTVADARGLPHRHVFVLGLSEGLFPQPAPEDPLLLDSERERLRLSGIALPTQAERAGDDGLFYGLIAQAHASLTLSRPHSKNGELWAASHLWRATLAVFSDAQVEHIRLGDVPRDPATLHEAALAAADGVSSGQALSWVEPSYWKRIRRGRRIELSRMSRAPHDHYTGRLQAANLIAWAAQALNPDRVWSASQLNDYGLCGFRYFAGRLLRLEPLEEPEDGMDSRQLGTLYHEILEATYRRLGGAITPERRAEALAVLGEIADEYMASAPERLRFHPSLQWAQEQVVLRR